MKAPICKHSESKTCGMIGSFPTKNLLLLKAQCELAGQ